VHGLARRAADSRVFEAAGGERMAEALSAFRAYADADPALLVEDKGAAAALHYRRHPAAAIDCRDLALRLGESLGLKVQEGDMVVEVRAPGPDKGAVVEAFMAETPFAGHAPIFLGDDLTDEDGFRAAQRLGGFGVVVGARRPTAAAFALADVTAARAWLTAALDAAP
jgi:trehalose 6-phosphate phosphatase